MVSPIDYSSAFGEQSPAQSFAGGYQVGAAIRDDQQRQQALIAQQDALQRQQQAIQGLIANRNAGAQEYSAASLLFPGMKDQIKQAWDMKNTAQQESMIRDMGQAYAAVTAGRPDIAAQALQSRADAMEKAGANPQEIQAIRTQAQIIEAHPEFARTQIGISLASLPGGDKVLTGVSTAGTEQRAQDQAPAARLKGTAEAVIKQVEAENAPTATRLANENATEDAETKRANRDIARLNTQIAQANSETSRGNLILERDKLVQAQEEKKTAKQQAEQAKMDGFDRSLQTVDAIMKHPALTSFWSLGTPGTVAGKVTQYIPGSDRKDVQGLVDTLTSQQFLTSIKEMQGMGALSDAEGKRIASAVASLDLDQSAGAFKNALGVVRSTLEKARNRSVGTGNLPTSGGGFVMKHPQFGNVTEGDINRLMASQPGATREQVIRYLQSTGGK